MAIIDWQSWQTSNRSFKRCEKQISHIQHDILKKGSWEKKRHPSLATSPISGTSRESHETLVKDIFRLPTKSDNGIMSHSIRILKKDVNL